MRLIDADALRLMKVEECAGHSIEYAMGWKACLEYINAAPAIDAIPVEWLIEHDDEDIRDSDGNSYGRRKITVVEALSMWQEEQEA